LLQLFSAAANFCFELRTSIIDTSFPVYENTKLATAERESNS